MPEMNHTRQAHGRHQNSILCGAGCYKISSTSCYLQLALVVILKSYFLIDIMIQWNLDSPAPG